MSTRYTEGKPLKIGLYNYFLIFLCLALASQNAISQSNLDSLKSILPGLKGKNKLETYVRLAENYSYSDPNLYFKYSREGLDYALADGDSSYISRFRIELGYYYRSQGSFQESLNQFHRSAQISNKKGYQLLLSAAYTGLGSVYYGRALYDKALDYHSRSLSIKEELGDSHALGVSYNNIGLIYYKMDDPVRALENYEKSLNYKLANQDTADCAVNYLNIGLVYSQSTESEMMKKGIDSFRKAINVCFKYNKDYWLGPTYNGLGSIFAQMGSIDSANYYLEKSIEESLKKNHKILESSSYYLLAKLAFQQQEFEMALRYLQKSQRLLVKLKDKFRIKNNYRLYSDIFESRNMIDSAFVYEKKYAVMKDSIFSEELAKNFTNVQINAATYEQEQTISAQQNQISRGNLLAVFLSSILALSLALIFVIFRNYINTNKINKQLNDSNEQIEAQKRNLEKKNKQLAEAQVTIQKQNEVLKNINSDLDKKVKERTKELDKSNHELEKAVKDLDQFIYKTSHDLRGPIATMQGIINLGVLEAVDARSIEYFNTLHRVSNNLNNVLYRLIEVHETYQKRPELQALDPMREIMETTNRVSQFSMESDLTILTELQASGKWNSDKVLFNLVIENMLRSAILYRDRGESIIRIKSHYKNNHLIIVFEDNGFGIHPGDESKVFNIFFKGSPRPGGTGLEIYTAKIAAEKLGGDIKLKKPMKDTIFEINLPILKS